MLTVQAVSDQKLPWYFWALGVLGILWNGLGTVLWAGSTFFPDDFLKDLPPLHRAYVDSTPKWTTFTWALGVFGGLAGSVLLLMRNRLALAAFALSLVGAITNQLVYVTHPPPEGFINMPLVVFIVSFALMLFWFARVMKQRGIL